MMAQPPPDLVPGDPYFQRLYTLSLQLKEKQVSNACKEQWAPHDNVTSANSMATGDIGYKYVAGDINVLYTLVTFQESR
jgi:hypothetical protein